MPDVSVDQKGAKQSAGILTAVAARLLVLSVVGLASCAVAWLISRYFRGAGLPRTFDVQDARTSGDRPFLVEFTSPYCYECKEALPLLKAAAKVYDAPLTVIDAKLRPDLANKYSIRSTPTILVVDGKGTVTEGWLRSPDESELRGALESLALSQAI
ncbi:MAG: thioredoxin family protein [Actinomycetota bacterium]|nr:thioredoxin family protein [Actinomycetota bacterium]